MSDFSQISDAGRVEHSFRHRRPKSVRLYIGISIIGLGALLTAYYFGRPIIHKFRYSSDFQKAEQFEQSGDLRSAMLTWEQLNRLHPTDAEARRRLAAFYERAGQFESIPVWKEAVALDPGNQQGHLGLARAAIRFGDRGTARTILEKIPPDENRPAEYYRLRAALAVLDRDPRAQEENLVELARLEPDDERVRLNLAALRLADPHGGAARAALLELARSDKVRMRAVAELLGDVARRWPGPAPERDAALRALASALTPPRGPLLALPSQVDHIERLIRYAMEQPGPEAEDVISLTNWMSLNGQTETALQWIDTLPPRLHEHALLRTAQAEFAIRVRDWERLRGLLLAGVWGPVPTAVVEQAFRARGDATGRVPSGVRSGWVAALEAGKSSPIALRTLLRLAELWEWPAEHRQVLLMIGRTMPRETWAWRQLISLALAQGDSEQLWQVYNEWRLAVPGEPVAQTESAVMGHLLGWRRTAGVTETAEYVRQQPNSPGASVAHALALWRAGRTAEAVAVLDALPRAAFNEPRYALACGIVLAEAGRAVESEEMLNRLAGEQWLPGERTLLGAARARNRASRP